MPAKIVVTAQDGGSRVALVGAAGKALLTSEVFHEPRAKGATLRALRGLLGTDITVEDHTKAATKAKTATGRAATPAVAPTATAAATRPRSRRVTVSASPSSSAATAPTPASATPTRRGRRSASTTA